MRNYVDLRATRPGVAIYSVLDGINHTEAGHMRRVELDLQDVGSGHFKAKFATNSDQQLGRICSNISAGASSALMFFASLLHVFKRRETAVVAGWCSRCGAVRVVGMVDLRD